MNVNVHDICPMYNFISYIIGCTWWEKKKGLSSNTIYMNYNAIIDQSTKTKQ